MKMQTINRAGQPHDFSVFKHGTIGTIEPYTNTKHRGDLTGHLATWWAKMTSIDDPIFRYEDGAAIHVSSLKNAGATIVPYEG